ncbi:Stress-induced bacterial acidophilic repeat motif [Raoultella terrigena]|uniref:Stress-induced bacterial acidophilic repeat motif n=1 Tax=Raoultella terrigena TaxID=577 RepID=A0A3P8J1W2_RAOTE|nr:Stress-induced bacterial acidophilic repeat motif [Raoultella terrigena]
MANHRGGSGNFAEDRERASEAGRKGGQHSGGNFKNDPQRASDAGKKGAKTATAIVIANLSPMTLVGRFMMRG